MASFAIVVFRLPHPQNRRKIYLEILRFKISRASASKADRMHSAFQWWSALVKAGQQRSLSQVGSKAQALGPCHDNTSLSSKQTTSRHKTSARADPGSTRVAWTASSRISRTLPTLPLLRELKPRIQQALAKLDLIASL